MINKLLIVGYVWPEPNSSAAGSRMLELVKLFLAQCVDVVFASASALSEHRFNLTELGVNERSIALNCSSFDELLREIQPDAVLFDRFFTEEQFGWRVEKVCPNALRILDTEDLHSLRHARQQLLKKSQKNTRDENERQSVDPVSANMDELYEQMLSDDMVVREIAAIFRCDLTLMISLFEIELLTTYFSVPQHLLHYCPFLSLQLVDALPDFNDRQHFICIGNFRHEPNWDAVLYLKHAIWPRIRSQLPQAELHIYGAYPPPKATQLHNAKQGFYIKGWAEDAFAVMQQARVCLAPLRFGAGLKGKLMDAIRCGTPSVTTNIGAEGMTQGDQWAGLVANNSQQIFNAAVKLYSDEILWQESKKTGAEILSNYFSNKDYAQLFIDRLSVLKKHQHQERTQNFIGTMLRHHSLKSTQYMSQWIEAKSK